MEAMIDIVFRVFLFFFLWWLVLKVMIVIEKSNTKYYERRKPNYGIFYNPLIQDKRDFNIGHKVFFYGEKYYVVGIEYNNVYKSWVALHLSKTMNDVMYKDDGLVVDSREVKMVIRNY